MRARLERFNLNCRLPTQPTVSSGSRWSLVRSRGRLKRIWIEHLTPSSSSSRLPPFSPLLYSPETGRCSYLSRFAQTGDSCRVASTIRELNSIHPNQLCEVCRQLVGLNWSKGSRRRRRRRLSRLRRHRKLTAVPWFVSPTTRKSPALISIAINITLTLILIIIIIIVIGKLKSWPKTETQRQGELQANQQRAPYAGAKLTQESAPHVCSFIHSIATETNNIDQFGR